MGFKRFLKEQQSINPLCITIEWIEVVHFDDGSEDTETDYVNVRVSDVPSSIDTSQLKQLCKASFKNSHIDDYDDTIFIDYQVQIIRNHQNVGKVVKWLEVVDFCNQKLLSDDFTDEEDES